MKVDIKVDRSQIKNYIAKLKSYFAKDIVNDLTDIGNKSTEETKGRLTNTKKSPNGNSFANLSPGYLAWKLKYHGSEDIGILSGRMRDNVKSKVDKLTMRVGVDSSVKSYPAVFQFGKSNQPARPFLGFSDGEIKSYIKILTDRMELR